MIHILNYVSQMLLKHKCQSIYFDIIEKSNKNVNQIHVHVIINKNGMKTKQM